MAKDDEPEGLGKKASRLFDKAVGVYTEATANEDVRARQKVEDAAAKKAKDKSNQEYWCAKGDKVSCDELKKYASGGVVNSKPRGCGCAVKGFGKGKMC